MNFQAMIAEIFQSLDSSDGRVVRASASVAVDLDLLSSRIKPITLKSVFTVSLIDAQHWGKCGE